ncbi:hypothetical protein IMG5_071830 [Ichthyophthirius multifiliis]|uniref:CRAL-TRIO domain-containing protein n=1 Tax=Ichthyophthirius multifiliis TaxID=5932 RepID=G0QPW2_ICHMU|nr:hypothetical protein IMG5_071830 [Ichthyophthirius multifiliis]EGR32740.1 hypothetical protein IMG5_071830 [Ichthyophthirius multifiliis]|eukprot:XP_004036726.1 hypothetical protein IMG5_071830 [Ichthyophthirius multifiliis]
MKILIIIQAGFKIQKRFNLLNNHNNIQQIENHKTYFFNIYKIQEQGYVYLGGRDKSLRPTIIFRVDLMDLKKITQESILQACFRIFQIAEETYFYPYHIENWNVFIQTQKMNVFSFPFKVLGEIIKTMQNIFPSNLNKLFILNPSKSLNFSWNVIKSLINERSLKKIQFLDQEQLKQLLQIYDSDQLEEAFGGAHPNLSIFYPPQNFNKIRKQEQQQQFQNQNNNDYVKNQNSSNGIQYYDKSYLFDKQNTQNQFILNRQSFRQQEDNYAEQIQSKYISWTKQMKQYQK